MLESPFFFFQFYSANCFMSLFWIAFVRQNMEELRLVSHVYDYFAGLLPVYIKG
jgi:hypothetical protein